MSIEWQEQIVIGTVLGGSSLVRPPKGMNYYLSMRGQNELWLKYKMAELTKYFRNPTVHKYGKTYRCNSNCCNSLTQLHGLLYSEEDKRIVLNETLEPLRDIGLAIWFLDGGGKTGRGKKNAYLNVTKFGDEGSELVKNYFDSISCPCEIHKNGNRRRVLFSISGTIMLLKTIAHRFPEFMYHRL